MNRKVVMILALWCLSIGILVLSTILEIQCGVMPIGRWVGGLIGGVAIGCTIWKKGE